MRKLYKFLLDDGFRTGAIDIPMPENADILSVGIQENKNLVVWAICNPETPKVLKRFHLVATGEEVNMKCFSQNFLGTVTFAPGLIYDIPLVLHVFKDVG